MMLAQQSQIPASALPVDVFKEHLRLGTGFADDGAEDGLLETYLRAALTAVEAWTGKVLLTREYHWTINRWRDAAAQALPVAPVEAIGAIRFIDRLGWEEAVPSARYRLQVDTHRPLICATSALLPEPPTGGDIRIEFTAGFGPTWEDVPSDLGQAVVVLAAHYYEYRHDMRVGEGVIPYTVSALIERWRTVRILGGGRGR
ncbi:hypothetical protein IV417_06685 [Alphaproteobacteria bacterium KMM 3653]|uniref:Gene transfer agent protein n=1 Tax=Harenicola maris TaxID=2841044 RepID=A0AAP2CMF5_9RHOB|nr:hypothetical protein [Harenicola maris]